MQGLKILALCVLVPATAAAQTELPVIRSNVRIISIRDGETFKLNAWRLEPETKPDIYEADLVAGKPHRVTFITDVDSIGFLVRPDGSYDFIIVNGADSSYTRIVGIKRPPAAVFDAAYQAEYRGKITVQVPEVYELVNVAIALTKRGQEDNGLVYKATDYYKAVREWFDPYRGHALIAALDSALSVNLWTYMTLKMNGYAFEFDGDDNIVRSRIYDRTGFDGERSNSLQPYVAKLDSFARQSDFRTFYRQHRPLYDAQTAFFRDTADLAEMKRWLDRQFPSSNQYDAYKIVFSPLVAYNQSSTWFKSNGFAELQPHVNFPYYQDLSRLLAQQQLSTAGANLYRGIIVFTEINHGYINPEASKYAERILQATSQRNRWVTSEHGPGYYGGTSLFNEYMNWALISLRILDYAAPQERDVMISNIERTMTSRRGFLQFDAFNRFLLDLYRRRPEGQTVADLYPRIIEWFEAHNSAAS